MKTIEKISKVLKISGILLAIAFLFMDVFLKRPGLTFGKRQLLGLGGSLAMILLGWLITTKTAGKLLTSLKSTIDHLLDVLDKKLTFTTSLVFPKITPKQYRIYDWLVIVCFAIYGLLFFLGRWNGITPFIDLKGDGASVAGFAAALDHPELFKNDFLLHDLGNIGSYNYAHVPLVRFLASIVKGYGTAFLVLLVPIIFLQMTGFYVLGKVLFKSRFWALLLAIFSTFLIYTESKDYWGLFIDPQPRMLFQSFFPWVLSLAYISRDHLKLRWITMIVLGFMSFIHQISTPAIALSVWLGFLVFKPASKSWKRHLIELFGMGLLFLISLSPVFFSYFQTRQVTDLQIDYTTASKYISEIYPATYNSPDMLLGLIKLTTQAGLLPVAILSAGFLLMYKEKRKDLFLVLTWITGILITAVLLSVLQIKIDDAIEKLPVFLQLPRNLRYLVPMLEILALWSLAALWVRTEITSKLPAIKRSFTALLGILIVSISSGLFQSTTIPALISEPVNYPADILSCWMSGKPTCPSDELLDQLEMVEYIGNNTPIGSRFISIPPLNINGAIRYQALRPIIITQSDVNKQVLSDVMLSMSYSDEVSRWNKIRSLPSEERVKGYYELAVKYGADFVVSYKPTPSWLGERVIFENTTLSLIKVHR